MYSVTELRSFLTYSVIVLCVLKIPLALTDKAHGPGERRTVPVPAGSMDTCTPPKKNCPPNDIYYTLDGSCNNVNHSSWGQAGTPYLRFFNPGNYSDGKCALRKGCDGKELRSARECRTVLLPDKKIKSRELNIMSTGMGQYLDHDATSFNSKITQSPCCTNGSFTQPQPDGCIPIKIPENDWYYSKFNRTCMSMSRANNTYDSKCGLNDTCVPINYVTSYLDLSFLYGNDENTTKGLRTMKCGKMRTYSNDKGQELYPELEGCPVKGAPCWQCGDSRAGVGPEITTIGITLLRMHNVICSTLCCNGNDTDEKLFQECRRILIAFYQHIVYNEYCRAVFGEVASKQYNLLPTSCGYAKPGYDPNMNAQTRGEYASACGRCYHNTLTEGARYRDSQGKWTSYDLDDKFLNQTFMIEGYTFLHVLRSFLRSSADLQDQCATPAISENLFPNPVTKIGGDLISIDIQRGRDYGMPPWNKVIENLGGQPFSCFDDLKGIIRNDSDICKLKELYCSIWDVDLYVGALLEKSYYDSTLGPTCTAINCESMKYWKFGDRLFYEFEEAKFSLEQLAEIKKVRFAHLLCWTNSNLNLKVPWNAFERACKKNHWIKCKDIMESAPNILKLRSDYQ